MYSWNVPEINGANAARKLSKQVIKRMELRVENNVFFLFPYRRS